MHSKCTTSAFSLGPLVLSDNISLYKLHEITLNDSPSFVRSRRWARPQNPAETGGHTCTSSRERSRRIQMEMKLSKLSLFFSRAGSSTSAARYSCRDIKIELSPRSRSMEGSPSPRAFGSRYPAACGIFCKKQAMRNLIGRQFNLGNRIKSRLGLKSTIAMIARIKMRHALHKPPLTTSAE